MREIVVPSFVSMSQPVAETLEQLAAVGIRFVELLADAPDRHIDLADEAAVSALAEVVRGLPLAVYSVHGGFSNPSEEAWDISQPDPVARAAAVRRHAQVVRASALLGAHHVVIHPGVRHRGEDRLRHSRGGLAELAEVAREAGTVLAVENLPPNHLCGSLAETQHLLDGLDPAVIGFCLDTGHAMLGQDTIGDYIHALSDRLTGIHWHASDHAEDAHLFPDVERGEWDEFFAALDEVGYDSPVTVESVPPPTTPLEDAIQAVRAALQGERTTHVA
jgi:sugar phosphate isomerase/epimerase